MRGSPELERAVHSRVLSWVQTSDALSGEYARRHRVALWERLAKLAFLAGTVAGGVVAPLGLAIFELGPLSVQEQRFAGQNGGRLLPLAIQSLWFTALSVMSVMSLRQSLARSREVTLAALYPTADDEVRRKQLRQFAAAALLLGVNAAIVLCALAYVQHLPAVGWLAAFALALLQYLVWLAAVFVHMAYAPRRFQGYGLLLLSGVILFVVGMGAIMLGFIPLHYERAIALPALVLFPSGWVNAAFQFAVVERRAWGWLFVVPALALVAAAANWLRRPFTIVEFRILKAGEAEAVLSGARWYPLPPMPRWMQPPSERLNEPPTPADLPLDEAVARDLVASGRFPAPLDWSRLGWVERFVARHLTDRERTLLEFHRTSAPGFWTLCWFFGGATIFIYSLLHVFHPSGPDAAVAEAFMSAVVLIGFYVATLPTRPREHLGPIARGVWYAQFPVGFRELSSVMLKVAVLRSVAALPLAAPAVLAGAGLWALPWFGLVVRGLHAAVLVVAAQDVLFCLGVSANTNDTARYRVFAIWTVFLLLFIAVGMTTILSPSTLWATAAAFAAASMTFLFHRYYAELYDEGRCDIVR